MNSGLENLEFGFWTFRYLALPYPNKDIAHKRVKLMELLYLFSHFIRFNAMTSFDSGIRSFLYQSI